jgi:oligoendopeptidase F
MSQTPPRWDLSNIYASLDDPKLQADIQAVITQTQQLAEFYQQELAPLAVKELPSSEVLAQRLNKLVDELNTLLEKAYTIGAYLYLNISTNSFDKQAEQMLSRFQIDMVPLENLLVQAAQWLGKVHGALPAALQHPGSANQHAFFLLEEAEQSRYLMSEAEEMLANELTLSGVRHGVQLQGVLTSQKTAEFELEGEVAAAAPARA